MNSPSSSRRVERTFVFGLIVGITAMLIVLQRVRIWQARRLDD